jgi:hypothetical protein
MSTTIGTVTLDRDMIFSDEYEYNMVASEVERTIGGGLMVQEYELLEKGRPITLIAEGSVGLQQKSTVDSLKDLADAGVYNTYTLTITSNSQTFTKTVRFRHEIDGGPVQFKPIQDRDGLHSDTVYYTGTIYLMVV